MTHPYSWPEVRRGAERIIMETARALAGRGHEVTVFTTGNQAGTSDFHGARIVRFRRIFSRDWMHEHWFGWRVTPHLARGFDVVHSFMPRDALAAIRTRRIGGHTTLYDEMGVPYLIWDTLRDRGARRKVVSNVDIYGCMSQYALDALRSSSDRVGVRIPGGVRMSEFQPVPEREPAPTLLFSGAFDEGFKGVASLLKALPMVAEIEPDVRLWLSGPGDGKALFAAAPEEARRRTEIMPLGEPSDQAERYARAWVAVQPSVGESFGMVTLEALACGTPVVTSDQGALQELVSATTGAVSEAGNPESLAKAVLHAIDLARDPATIGACRSSAEPYDWDTGVAPLLEDLYAGGPRP